MKLRRIPIYGHLELKILKIDGQEVKIRLTLLTKDGIQVWHGERDYVRVGDTINLKGISCRANAHSFEGGI